MRLLDNASKNKPFEHCSIIGFAKLDTTGPAGWLEVVLPIMIISVKRRPTLKEIRQNGKTVEC